MPHANEPNVVSSTLVRVVEYLAWEGTEWLGLRTAQALWRFVRRLAAQKETGTHRSCSLDLAGNECWNCRTDAHRGYGQQELETMRSESSAMAEGERSRLLSAGLVSKRRHVFAARPGHSRAFLFNFAALAHLGYVFPDWEEQGELLAAEALEPLPVPRKAAPPPVPAKPSVSTLHWAPPLPPENFRGPLLDPYYPGPELSVQTVALSAPVTPSGPLSPSPSEGSFSLSGAETRPRWRGESADPAGLSVRTQPSRDASPNPPLPITLTSTKRGQNIASEFAPRVLVTFPYCAFIFFCHQPSNELVVVQAERLPLDVCSVRRQGSVFLHLDQLPRLSSAACSSPERLVPCCSVMNGAIFPPDSNPDVCAS